MSYLERLLSRALAVPRESPRAVFDPFAEVADWALETPDRPATPERTEPVQALPAPPPAATPDRIIAPDRSAPIPAIRADDPPTPRTVAAPPAKVAAPPDRDETPAPKPSRPKAPIEVADQFMRSLAQPVAPEAAPPPSQTPAVVPTRVERRAADETDPVATPVRRSAVAPPAPPSITARTARAQGRDRPAADPAPARPREANAKRAAPPKPSAPAPRKPARTAARREELAHSVGILRFGLNQV